jgi:hypothetical protein
MHRNRLVFIDMEMYKTTSLNRREGRKTRAYGTIMRMTDEQTIEMINYFPPE